MVLVGAPQFGWRIQFNEAMFVVIGREILAGGDPYLNAFDQKPPLIYYFYALVQGVTGDGFMVSRLLIFAALAVTAVLVALCAREFYGRRLAFVSGLAFALSVGAVAIAPNAGLDQLTLLPLVFALYLVLVWRRTRVDGLLIAAGAAAACALLLKPVALPTALLLGGVVIASSRALRPPVLLASSALACGLVVVGALYVRGVLPAAYDAMVVFGGQYAAQGWDSSSPELMAGIWAATLGPIVVPAALSLVVLGWERSVRAALLGALVVASVVGIALPGAFLPYYVWLLCPTLALVTPVVFEAMGGWSRRARLAVLAPGAFVFTLCAFAALALPVAFAFQTDVPDSEALGRAIASGAAPGDRLWVRANVPEVYYYAGLRPAHRYFQPMPVIVRPGGLEEVVSALTVTPPKFMVFDGRDEASIAPFAPLLGERYEPFAVEGPLVAYRRLD